MFNTTLDSYVNKSSNIQIDKVFLNNYINILNETIPPLLQKVQFVISEDNKDSFVKVIDTSTKETIRHILNEDLLSMVNSINRAKSKLHSHVALP